MDVKEFENKLYALVGTICAEKEALSLDNFEQADEHHKTGIRLFDELLVAFKAEVFRQ